MAVKYKIGSIPPLRVWSGEKLSLTFTTDLTKKAVFSKRATPSPKGTMTIDQNSGEFLYIPSKEDKEEITVSVSAKEGDKEEKQNFTVIPVQQLPPENHFLAHTVQAPDPSSSIYIKTSERDLDKEVFNNISNYNNKNEVEIVTKEVSVSGVKLIFEKGSVSNVLFDKYNGRKDIKKMNIYADEVVIKSQINLPGTAVSIYSRILSFEGEGCINTTPLEIQVRSDKDEALKGADAGDINLFVKQINMPGNKIRLTANGAKGQNARLGEKGTDGGNVTHIWDGTHEVRSWYPFVKINVDFKGKFGSLGDYKPVYALIRGFYETVQGYGYDIVDYEFGSKEFPGDGKDPKIMTGRPGQGGSGGNMLCSSKDILKDRVKMNAGNVGEMAKDIPATNRGTPENACYVQAEYYVTAFTKWEDKVTITEKRTSSVGKESKALGVNPQTPKGKDGEIKTLTAKSKIFWIHPVSVQTFLQYVHDVFLAEGTDKIRDAIIEYLSDMSDDGKTKIPVEISSLHSELLGLTQRMDGPFDYFGNPAGWVPMLSFESNLKLYKSEIENSIRILFFSYWIEKNQANKEKSFNSLKKAIEQLNKETDQAIKDFETAQEKLTDIDSQYENLCVQIKQLGKDLKSIEKELERKAKDDLQLEHIIRSSGKILGGILQLIPAGQPVLGMVGKGISVVSDIDIDSPMDSAPELAGIFAEFANVKLKPKVEEFIKPLLEYYKKQNEKPVSESDKKFNDEIAKKELDEKVKKHLEETKKAKEQISKAFGNFTVPKEEIEAEVERIKAQCPEYKEIAEKIQKLGKEKSEFAAELLTVMQTIDEKSALILNNQLAGISIRSQLTETLNQINHEMRQYSSVMGQRARNRLIKYQYYLVKSYNYLMIQDIPGTGYAAEKIVDTFADMLPSSKDGSLTEGDFNKLKAVFEDQLKTVTTPIIDWFVNHPPKQGSKLFISLTEDQIKELNSSSKFVNINLMDMGYLDLRQEDIRITDMKAKDVKVIDPPLDKAVNVNLTYKHSGESTIRRGGSLFLFRTGSSSATSSSYIDDHLFWGTSININNGNKELTPMKPDPAEESLIKYLTAGENRDTSPLLNYRPSAWADIKVQRSATPLSFAGKVNSLVLEIDYVFHSVIESISTLYVNVHGGIKPYIQCSVVDLNGHSDGTGNFLRSYNSKNTKKVVLKAPAKFGGLQFIGWETADKVEGNKPMKFFPLLLFESSKEKIDYDKLIKEQEITLDMKNDQVVTAVYLKAGK